MFLGLCGSEVNLMVKHLSRETQFWYAMLIFKWTIVIPFIMHCAVCPQYHCYTKACRRWIFSPEITKLLGHLPDTWGTSRHSMWTTTDAGWGFRGVFPATVAVPAGSDRKTRHRVPAEKHKAKENPWMDQTNQQPGWDRSPSTSHVEGKKIAKPLRIGSQCLLRETLWLLN